MNSYPQQTSYETTSKSAKELNPEELQHLLNKLSSDESAELKDMMRKCASEVTMTRGVPMTALLLGSLYFARTRLPKQYHFGPKGWPFYAIMGIGSLTVSNLFFMGTCKDRLIPKVNELWQKYQSLDNKKMTYDYLRQQHRTGQPLPEAQYSPRQETTYETLRHEHREESNLPISDNFIYNAPQNSFVSSYKQSQEEMTSRKPYIYDSYSEGPTYMSGTPSGASRPMDSNSQM